MLNKIITVKIENYKYHKKRLDIVLNKILIKYSRSKIKNWILNNLVTINNNIINKPKKKFLLMIL